MSDLVITDKPPILITAGGTGGHVYPGLAVARALQEQDIPVIWMGTKKGLESRVIPAAGIEMAWLDVSGIRGKGLKAVLLAPFRLTKALIQSVKIMKKHKPAAVLGMGGFVAGPGGLVASMMGIPVIIHEQNARAGTTNKLLSRVVLEILEGFPGTFPEKVDALPVGNPVRPEIAALPVPAERLAGRENKPFRLLIVGGSLGAKALNELVPRALCNLPKELSIEVVHQAGEATLDLAKKTYEAAAVPAHIVAFIEDMAGAYEWADLIICRAGALTIAEVSAAGLAAILVPYPFAIDDHQTENAKYLAEKGAAILAQQDELTQDALTQVLEALMTDRDRLLEMSNKAREAAMTDATQKTAIICADIAGYPFQVHHEVLQEPEFEGMDMGLGDDGSDLETKLDAKLGAETVANTIEKTQGGGA
ncbi:MAG: undecaprenyldiphospho-muramoylpentapeptide beta-N-acetylglucosaminyltransferase [Thiotrichaceae bacterium]